MNLKVGAIVLLVIGAFGWGLAAGSYEIFPYQLVQSVKNALDGDDGTRDPAQYIGNELATEVGASDTQWGTRARNVMIGDSLTAHARIEEMFPEASIANRGLGGDTIQGALDRLPGILELEPSRALILMGHNDIFFDNPPDEIVTRFEQLIARLQAADVEPVLQSIIICGDNPVCTPARRKAAAEVNTRLERLAEERGIAFVDLNPALTDRNGLKSEMTWDGIHLAARGNREWRDAIAPYVLGADAQ